MARPTKEQIAQNIRDAVVIATAAKGISAVSMGDVAKTAKVSAGTLYLHFENKTDMLQKTYLHIKRALYDALIASTRAETSKLRIRGLWNGLFAFAKSHPQEFLFVDNAGAAQILTSEQFAEASAMQNDLVEVLEAAVKDGTLAPLPIDMITVLLVAPALHMARASLMHSQPLDPKDLDLTFDRVWLSIRAAE